MSLYKYSSWAWQIAESFRGELSFEDAEELHKDLTTLGIRNWLTWVYENQSAILSLLSDTQAKRAKRKDWRDPILKRRLVFAAYHRARLGALVLDSATRVGSGGGYRDTCTTVAYAGLEILDGARWFWPFEGKPPFEGWEPPEDLDFSISYVQVVNP